jgi:hypothetical protein
MGPNLTLHSCHTSYHTGWSVRKLRDSAWRAFALVLGKTVFDIRSRLSMENLAKVTKCDRLAPAPDKRMINKIRSIKDTA